MPDDPALVESFLAVVEKFIIGPIEAAGDRLKGYRRLIQQYREQCEAWRAGHLTTTHNITERVNELCIAKLIVEDPTVSDAEYEAALAGTGRTIDFLVRPKCNPGLRLFYDVKTVHPEERDAWERYQRATVEDRWTPNTTLALQRDWMGGEIAHEKFASREKFIEHTLALEAKIHAMPERDDTFFRMVFCGNGFHWTLDELEDFAETYFTGHCRWDHFATMQEYTLKREGLAFSRTIAGFCCLIRQVQRLDPAYRPDVRLPQGFR